MATQHSTFRPAWWLPGPHLQTIYPTFSRRMLRTPLQRERVELPDGDFIDLDWAGQNHGPIVLILHGVSGSRDSHYVRGMMRAIYQQGWRAVLMHFRGCSGEPNRLQRGYHAGDTADVAHVIRLLRRREPNIPLMSVGFSMGGNVLLKLLGDTGQSSALSAAVAISVPFELNKAAERMSQGSSRFYQWWLLSRLRRTMRHKCRTQPENFPLDLKDVRRLKTFYEFDDNVTAPLHGFANAEHYYQTTSCRRQLNRVSIPTLILQSADDPLLTDDVIPEQEELSEHITLELSERGGHMGFVGGKYPWKPEYWVEQRAVEYLQQFLS